MAQEKTETFFQDDLDAAKQLYEILSTQNIHSDDWLLVAINAEALRIVDDLAKRLHVKYDLLFIEPIYAPNNNECAVAMVSETEEIVLHQALVDAFDISLDFVYAQAHRQYEEKILKKIYQYRRGDLISTLADKNVLLVDLGCETGMSALIATKTAIGLHAKSVAYATPVIASNVLAVLDPIIDEIFTSYKVSNFVDAGFYYAVSNKMSSEDEIEIIKNAKNYLPFQKIGEK